MDKPCYLDQMASMHALSTIISHTVKWQIIMCLYLLEWNEMGTIECGKMGRNRSTAAVTSDSTRPITLLPLLLSRRTLLSPDSIPQIPEHIM